MSKIYIVYSGVHYEGTDNICAFESEDAAKQLVQECDEHHATKPTYPSGEYDEKTNAKYERAEKRWRAALPGGEATSSADFFGYHELELRRSQNP